MYAGPTASPTPGPGGGPIAGVGPGPGAFTAGPGTASGGDSSDLADWRLWWRYNQAAYLALKVRVRSADAETGTPPWFIGDESRKGTLGPNEQQIRTEIVPALIVVLEHETDNDLVTGALVALAKIGDRGDPAESARLEAAISRFLGDSNQEIRETAAVALGILGNPRSIPVLAHLAWNTEEGRKLAEGSEVDYRTRSFAAYGLGLIGARTGSEIDRQLVVSIIRRGLEE